MISKAAFIILSTTVIIERRVECTSSDIKFISSLSKSCLRYLLVALAFNEFFLINCFSFFFYNFNSLILEFHLFGKKNNLKK